MSGQGLHTAKHHVLIKVACSFIILSSLFLQGCLVYIFTREDFHIELGSRLVTIIFYILSIGQVCYASLVLVLLNRYFRGKEILKKWFLLARVTLVINILACLMYITAFIGGISDLLREYGSEDSLFLYFAIILILIALLAISGVLLCFLGPQLLRTMRKNYLDRIMASFD